MQYQYPTNPVLNAPINDKENDNAIYNQMKETEEEYDESDDESEFGDKLQYNMKVDTHLQKSTTELDSELQYTIHLCMYNVMMDAVEPYLLYFMQKDATNTKIEFPKYTFQMKSIVQPLSSDNVQYMKGGNTEIDGFEAEFEDLLFQQIRMYMQGGESIQIGELYEGFRVFLTTANVTANVTANSTTESPQSNELIVFVNASTLPIQRANLFKVSVYELLCSKKVFEMNINETIPAFFQHIYNKERTRDLHHILNVQTEEYVETPYCLYLCTKNTMGNYVTSLKIDPLPNPITTLVLGKTQHPILGEHLIFSNKPQNVLFSSYDNLRRFLVFSKKEHTAFIEGNLTLNNIFSDDSPNYSAITFIEGGNQFWAVGSSLFVEEIL